MALNKGIDTKTAESTHLLTWKTWRLITNSCTKFQYRSSARAATKSTRQTYFFLWHVSGNGPIRVRLRAVSRFHSKYSHELVYATLPLTAHYNNENEFFFVYVCRHCSSSPVLTSRLIVSKWLWQFSIIDQNETDRTYPNKHWPRFGIIWWWWWFDFWLNIMAVDIIIVIRNTLIWSHLSWATIRAAEGVKSKWTLKFNAFPHYCIR